FESTSNALERSLFLLKDTLAVVDDWRPAVSRGDASEMDRKAQRLLRAVGNRQGRGRMTSDTTLRRSYSPRGLVIATAEALPEGPAFESAAARSLSVNLSRSDIDLGCLSELAF
ncbi:MAG: CHC2 zinc finger domain-containing protein, partial [Rubrobacter sp.]